MFRRRQIPWPAQARAMPKTFPAPIRGWIESESLAKDIEAGASRLENFFPTTRGIRPRGGSLRHATITAGVKSLMVWRSGTAERLFGADSTAIYDITSPANPAVQPAPAVSGQASGFYSSVMFAATSGDYLVAVNGTDERRLYDGGGWATMPAMTGVASSSLSHVWVFKNRLFFVQKNTMNAWCLGIDAIGGPATQISLSGVFKKGGSLLFGDSWSVDAGDGLDDICVFVSSLGEVVAFSGSDPVDPLNWSMEGRYDIGRPLGPNAYMRAGGDLVIATIEGMVPLSAAMNKDPSALTLAAVTRAIEQEWKRQAVARETSLQWSCLKWVARNMAIIGLPTVGAAEVCAYVVNLLTGAWAKYTGWDVACQAEMGSRAFFGTPGGGVMIAEAGGSDDGAAYQCTYVGLYDHLRSPVAAKTAKMARTSWLYRQPFISKVSMSTDYIARLPPYPPAAQHPSLDVWDVGLWDVALWDAGTAQQLVTRWVAVAGQGFALAPNIQITCSNAGPPEAELISVELLYEQSGMAV